MTTTEQEIKGQEVDCPEQTVNETIKRDPPKVQTPVLVRDGALTPTNASELVRTIAQIAKGGGFPVRFENLEQQLAAYNLAHSLMGTRWQMAIAHIAIIKGTMSIYGELPGALAEQTKEVAEKDVFCIDSDYKKICLENRNITAKPWAGVCLIQRKGRSLKEFTYTIDEAIHAGQYPAKRRDGSINNDSPWMKFIKVMLMRKAMALAIKMEFADALLGTPIAEYEYDQAPDLRDVSSKSETAVDPAKELNNIFQ